MKSFLGVFLSLFISFFVFADTPAPINTSKISGDSSDISTVNFRFPNFTGSHSGKIVTLGTLGVAGGGTGVGVSSGANSVVLRDANANITANGIIPSFRNQTFGTVGTLTIADAQVQEYSGGSGTQTVNLPTTGIKAGQQVVLINNGPAYSSVMNVNSSSGAAITSLSNPSTGIFTALVDNPTGSSNWSALLGLPNFLAFNSSLISASTGAFDLGSPTKYWNNGYITNLYATNISGSISGTATNITGTLAIANGGTGQSTASGAITALLPSQTGNGGKVLTTDGTLATWGTMGSGGTSFVAMAPLALSSGNLV